MNREIKRAALARGFAWSAALFGLACGGKAIGGAEATGAPCGSSGKPCLETPAAFGAPAASASSPPLKTFVPDLTSCSDNPLLAGCPPPPPVANTNSRSPAQPGSQASPQANAGAPVDGESARAAAQNVLLADCGQCHGPELTPQQAQAGINYINDIDELVDNGDIVPLNSMSSLIIQVMRTGAMPPLTSRLPPVPDSDINIVAEYIDNPAFWADYQPNP